MANKYCNLYGANKIKDDYGKINTGFEQVEFDVANIRSDIDDLIIEDNSLQGQINNLTLSAVNANIGQYVINTTGTDIYTGTYVGLSLAIGMMFTLNITNKNTGASSFNLNNTVAYPIKVIDDNGNKNDVQAGELYGYCTVIFDGVDFMLINRREATTTLFTTSDSTASLPVGTLDGPVDNLKLEGLSLANSVFIDTQTPYTPSGIGHRLKPNASDGVITTNSSYNMGKQVVSIVTGQEWFIYAKANQNTLNGAVGMHYSNGTSQTVGGSGDGKNEVYGTVVANATLLANPFILDNNAGNAIQTTIQSFVVINKQALGIEDFTESQILDLVRSGHIDGLQSIIRPTVESVGKNEVNPNNLAFGSFSTTTGEIQASTGNIINVELRKVKPSTAYYVNADWRVVACYDSQGAFISSEALTGAGIYITPSNCFYVRNRSFNGLTNLETFRESIMVHEGTTAAAYEPYKSSKVTLDIPLRRVPAVRDKAYEADGVVWKEKNVEEYTLVSSDIQVLDTSLLNVDRVQITKANLNGYLYKDVFAPSIGSMILGDYLEFSSTTIDDAQNIYKFNLRYSNPNINILVPKGTYANLVAAQADIAGKKIHYQRTTPELINLTEQGLVEGQLEAFENGTVYSYSDTFHSHSLSFDVPSNQGAQITALLQSANAQAKKIAEKANKVQEDWIEPTLLNGWVNNAVNNWGYYKDDFGNVNIEINIKDGVATTNTILFTLPVEYRPYNQTIIPGVRATNGTITNAFIQTNGNVIIGVNGGVGVFYFNGKFKAKDV